MREVDSNPEIQAQMPKTLSRRDLRRVYDFWTGGPEKRYLLSMIGITALTIVGYILTH